MSGEVKAFLTRNLLAVCKMHFSTVMDNADTLAKWVRAQTGGMISEAIEVRQTSCGRALFAKCQILPMETVISIPKSAMITAGQG